MTLGDTPELLSCYDLACDLLDETGDTIHTRAGACLWAALFVGPRNKPIAAHTDVPIEDVMAFGVRLRKAGRWLRGEMHYRWVDYAENGKDAEAKVSFSLDVLIATGQIVVMKPGGDLYRAAHIGEEGVADPEREGWPLRSTVIGESQLKPRKCLRPKMVLA